MCFASLFKVHKIAFIIIIQFECETAWLPGSSSSRIDFINRHKWIRFNCVQKVRNKLGQASSNDRWRCRHLLPQQLQFDVVKSLISFTRFVTFHFISFLYGSSGQMLPFFDRPLWPSSDLLLTQSACTCSMHEVFRFGFYLLFYSGVFAEKFNNFRSILLHIVRTTTA